jgi:hypothetical protein
MNRRSFFSLVLLPVPAALVEDDRRIKVNEWTAGRRIPQMVRVSDIARAELVLVEDDNGWVNVILKDQCVVSSEMASEGRDIMALWRELNEAGVTCTQWQ